MGARARPFDSALKPMRVAAIIQARMKSTRLPGKVLMKVGGRPVLEHAVRRLARAATITEIAIATSFEPEDDAIVAFGERHGVRVFRGPEANVLERFAIAARALDPDIIVRVTGDSPLVDPEIIDHLVCEMARTGADFLALRPGIKCIHEGVDPFSRRALRVLLGEAAEDPIAREHVTGWLKAHRERVRVAEIEIDPAWEFSGARLSIDTPADLEFFAALATRADLDTVRLRDVAALLRREPWLLAINAHVRQKAAGEREATVLLRADGGGALGYGHLTRTAALAEALRDATGMGVAALTGVHERGDAAAAAAFFEARRIPVAAKVAHRDEADFILEEARRRRASALVLDVRTRLSRADVERIRACGLKIIAIDDASERRLASDIAAYPPVPQAADLDWRAFAGEALIGPEWVLLASGAARRALEAAGTRTRLVVSMGGSDPLGLTLPVARACAQAIAAPIDVIVGPGVANARELAGALERYRNVTAHIAPDDPSSIFVQARLAVVAFGVTAYELAALGVPALYVALSEEHSRSALGAETLEFGKLGARAEGLDASVLALHAAALWEDGRRLAQMSKAGRASIDGRGAERLARKIADLIRAPAQPSGASPAPAETHPPSRRLGRAG